MNPVPTQRHGPGVPRAGFLSFDEGDPEARDARAFVFYGWDCIDCQGDFGVNDRCDTCGGDNRIPLWALATDAERMEDAINA